MAIRSDGSWDDEQLVRVAPAERFGWKADDASQPDVELAAHDLADWLNGQRVRTLMQDDIVRMSAEDAPWLPFLHSSDVRVPAARQDYVILTDDPRGVRG
jgi:hypothetical protein